MKRFLKSFRYGEKGFTLIELLIVVAILGILAVVIVPAAGKFIGRGTIEAANTGAHTVQTAVIACMTENTFSDFDCTVGPGDDTFDPTPADGTYPEDFLINPGGLQATYTITDGVIVSAVKIAGSKWGDLVYTPELGWHKPTT